MGVRRRKSNWDEEILWRPNDFALQKLQIFVHFKKQGIKKSIASRPQLNLHGFAHSKKICIKFGDAMELVGVNHGDYEDAIPLKLEDV